MSTLTYPALRVPRNIRLLRLDPGPELTGRVEVFSLDNLPSSSYQALSYTWGDMDNLQQIVINNQRFRVSRGLRQFLVRYKRSHAGQWIWIDQVCINQGDTKERNQQVKLMAEIYRGARQVIMWLRPNTTDNLVHPNRPCDNACRPACEWTTAMLNNTYWTRLWVIQEVVLAREREVWFGEATVPWDIFCSLINGPQAQQPALKSIMAFDTDKSGIFDLRSLLDTTHQSKCQKEQDHVYGIQALIPEADRVDIDYDKSPGQVFAEASAMILVSGLHDGPDLHLIASITSLANSMLRRQANLVNAQSVGSVYDVMRNLYERGVRPSDIKFQADKGINLLAANDRTGFDVWFKALM